MAAAAIAVWWFLLTVGALLGLSLPAAFSAEMEAGEQLASYRNPASLWVPAWLGAIAVLLGTRRPWSRHLMVGFWSHVILWVLVEMWKGEATLSSPWGPSVVLALAVWYLYFKPNVDTYHESLQGARRTPHTGPEIATPGA